MIKSGCEHATPSGSEQTFSHHNIQEYETEPPQSLSHCFYFIYLFFWFIHEGYCPIITHVSISTLGVCSVLDCFLVELS